MVKAWYLPDDIKDPKEPNLTDPPRYVSLDELAKLQVLLLQIPVNEADPYSNVHDLPILTQFGYRDIVEVSKNGMGDKFEENCRSFFQEHLHDEEEIRYILDGQGYFDVRDWDEKWIRILVEKGDLLIIPKGMYQRFTLDTNLYILSMRFFTNPEMRVAFMRGDETDKTSSRQEYLKLMKAIKS